MSTNSARMKELILANGAEITRLYTRIDETLRHRSSSPQGRDAWKSACAEFHSRYSALAFPGGYDGAVARLLAGDPEAAEATICFLECRPYFFRSGYMYKELLRKAKQAPLTPAQSERLAVVLKRLAEWRALRLAKNAA